MRHFISGMLVGALLVIGLAWPLSGILGGRGMAPPLGSPVKYVDYTWEPGWKSYEGIVTYRSGDSSVVIWGHCQTHRIIDQDCP